eukprot:TRINITY_DN2150_c0_g2_i1.p1 TRINITY_DN2150_c0_g2~~TRINITY_DN2150_c0_g2_i1.p1  ORF type:complete len:197 (-),score=28.51 TRINITY_DN2150_c0_g2_i1:155-745(-)
MGTLLICMALFLPPLRESGSSPSVCSVPGAKRKFSFSNSGSAFKTVKKVKLIDSADLKSDESLPNKQEGNVCMSEETTSESDSKEQRGKPGNLSLSEKRMRNKRKVTAYRAKRKEQETHMQTQISLITQSTEQLLLQTTRCKEFLERVRGSNEVASERAESLEEENARLRTLLTAVQSWYIQTQQLASMIAREILK